MPAPGRFIAWCKQPIEPVFDFVSAEDVLPKVLTGYGLIAPC